MDGSSYEIDTVAKNVGVTTSADELARLAGALDAAATVSTSFDAAIARTETLLASASSAATQAADAVSAGSTKYNQLETAAVRCAKAVEKASQAGKDTSELQAKANEASAALSAQGVALDELRAKSTAAAGAQAQLAGTLKSLQSAAKAEAAGLKTATAATGALASSSKALGPALAKAGGGAKAAEQGMMNFSDAMEGAQIPGANMIKNGAKLVKGLGATGLAGAAALGTVAVAALTAAVVLGVFALAKLAITTNKVAMAGLDKIAKKAKENFAKLFSGVHVEKFVTGVGQIAKQLDTSTAAGKGLQTLISTILNPLFDAIPKITPLVVQLFRGLVLGAMLAAIQVLKLYIALRNMVPESVKTAISDLAGKIDWLNTALYAGVAVVGVIAVGMAILGAIGLAIGATLAFVFTAVAAGLALIGLAVAGAIGGFIAMIAWAKAIGTALSNFASMAKDAAKGLIDGLVNGIKSGAGMVMQALKDLASNAISTLKNALKSHSPSDLTIAIGHGGLAGGIVEGVERGKPEVSAALSGLVDPSDIATGGAAGGAGGAAAKSGNTISIVIQAPDGTAQGIAHEVGLVLTRILEGDTTSLGGAVGAA